ncbi:MAG: hypothetical protein JXR21_01855 [Candidatus Marinimicrobia bacterium]|nr:hypothetical protein [Candidatus Neomarinimicrobiota bacterium]
MKHIQNIVYPYRNAELLIDYTLPDIPSDVTLVLGHGRYNDMDQPLLKYLSTVLSKENVNVVRFNYPFTETRPRIISLRRCMTAYRAVLEDLQGELPGTKFLFAGGKSLSALISSRLNPQNASGFVFLSRPLSTPGIRIPIPHKPLFRIKKPMLFVNGAEDTLSDRGRLELLMGALNPHAHLMLIPEAGHSLELLPGAKRSQEELYKEISDVLLWFMSDVIEKQLKN